MALQEALGVAQLRFQSRHQPCVAQGGTQGPAPEDVVQAGAEDHAQPAQQEHQRQGQDALLRVDGPQQH